MIPMPVNNTISINNDSTTTGTSTRERNTAQSQHCRPSTSMLHDLRAKIALAKTLQCTAHGCKTTGHRTLEPLMPSQEAALVASVRTHSLRTREAPPKEGIIDQESVRALAPHLLTVPLTVLYPT